MPRIISTNGRNNIEAIKKYFCSEYVVKFIAEETGMDYDTLISGEYKILLEPIAYYGRWDQVQELRKMPTNRMN